MAIITILHLCDISHINDEGISRECQFYPIWLQRTFCAGGKTSLPRWQPCFSMSDEMSRAFVDACQRWPPPFRLSPKVISSWHGHGWPPTDRNASYEVSCACQGIPPHCWSLWWTLLAEVLRSWPPTTPVDIAIKSINTMYYKKYTFVGMQVAIYFTG